MNEKKKEKERTKLGVKTTGNFLLFRFILVSQPKKGTLNAFLIKVRTLIKANKVYSAYKNKNLNATFKQIYGNQLHTR